MTMTAAFNVALAQVIFNIVDGQADMVPVSLATKQTPPWPAQPIATCDLNI